MSNMEVILARSSRTLMGSAITTNTLYRAEKAHLH
jgi:hypothetical protein